MSSDIYLVIVEARDDSTVRFRLQITHIHGVSFPLSPSFAMMLIADEGAPGFDAYRRWYEALARENEYFNPLEQVRAVRLFDPRGLPREPGPPPEDAERDAAAPIVLGEAIYEIVVDAVGMLAHLEPGASWGSTAYDELGTGPEYFGRPEDPMEWERPGF
jgi:hypothetical protein